MEAVQERKPRKVEARKKNDTDERRAVIEIAEITLKEIKIYADDENFDISEILQKLLKTKIGGNT